MQSPQAAVKFQQGHEYLADSAWHGSGAARAWYVVPSAAGGRLFRKQGWLGLHAGIAPWAAAAGIDMQLARVVSALPSAGSAPDWPCTHPQFPAPVRDGGSAWFSFGVPYELAIFRGHFPTVPIVPGAVLVGWSARLARQHCGWQHGVRYASALKFRRIVQPGLVYRLQIDVSAGGTTLEFCLRQDDALCARGSLMARPHDGP